jgi:ribosomal protein S6
MKGNSTHKYQMVTVLNPKTEDKDKALNKVSSWLESNKAEVTNKDHMGSKELVYKIKDQTKGDFWVFDIESTQPLKFKELNLLLNRETSIIRYLILKV